MVEEGEDKEEEEEDYETESSAMDEDNRHKGELTNEEEEFQDNLSQKHQINGQFSLNLDQETSQSPWRRTDCRN